MSQEGYLVISDITGYTAYLTESELEHARDSLTDLLSLLVEYTRSPFTISKLEGDAVLSYAPGAAFSQGQTLLEMTENTYLAFRKALELMVINTTCTCNACRNLPKLDLKFFLHFGIFTLQQVGTFTELLGVDVNLLHRLLKNHITEATGIEAYAAYTWPLVEELNLGEMLPGAPRHTEEFADVGEIELLIQDMEGVWEAKREGRRVRVTTEEAEMSITIDFALPQAQAWEYVTNPEFRNLMMGTQKQELRIGSLPRVGEGSVYLCAHGDNSVSEEAVLDWEPFEEYTVNYPSEFPETSCHMTFKLQSLASGTRLTALIGHITGPKADELKGAFVQMQGHIHKLFQLAAQKIEDDLENGKVTYYPQIKMTKEEFRASVEEALL